MTETPGTYNIPQDLVEEMNSNPYFSTISSTYFRRIQAIAEAAIIGGATDAEEIVDFAVLVVEKMIQKVGEIE